MGDGEWFDDLVTIGEMPPREAATKLREIGDLETALALENAAGETRHTFGLIDWWRGRDKPWQHTAHTFGYIEYNPDDELPIRNASMIDGESSLKNSSIKITLDSLRVADYPGEGTHRVLFDFYAQNQLGDHTEHLHFNATYRAREGEDAAVVGQPVFVGLNVGSEGIAFRCVTINVMNEEDDMYLSFLESDVFRAGLKLTRHLQPAISPLTGFATALTKRILSRHRNVAVQNFYLGLDFSSVPMRARLASGSYVAVQIPESSERIWDWNEWVFHRRSGRIVHKDDKRRLIPYNYVGFSVSRFH